MSASICPHLHSAVSDPPRPSSSVHREECTQCFDNQDSPDGIDVCLRCFNGGCTRLHAQAHADKLGDGHAVVVNIVRSRKVKPASKGNDDGQHTSPTSADKRLSGEPPAKRLAIREEAPEHEKYDYSTKLKCYACGGIDIQGNDKTDTVVKGIMASMSSAQQSEVKAWEEEITACEHSKNLVQEASKALEQSGLAHCSQCELTNNLWLCLTCGSLSCGRQQFGGLGGNGHALSHYSSTHHPVSVKLGTIEPDGSADIYCYACDDARLDPFLSNHLQNFGIHVDRQTKTEKSMTELQVEQNLKFDFAMTGGDGGDLEPLFGPGLTGLSNLGNSCYMASVLQALFSIPEFSDRYFTKGAAHSLLCQKADSANCFECQMAKIGDGLLSGRYAVPRSKEDEEDATSKAFAEDKVVEKPAGSGQEAASDGNQEDKEKKTKPFQVGIKPSMFKNLVGKDHSEFKTMRQQDSEEFFKHLIGMIQKHTSSSSSGSAGMDGEKEVDPTDIFKFTLEEKLQCGECKKVRYKNVNEETLSIPVPFIEKTKERDAMDIDGATAPNSEEKGKNAVEGENAQPAASTSTTTGGNDEKTEWESVKLEECLNLLTSAASIEYKCPSCNKNVYANKSTKFATFPDTLVLHAQRFRLHNWVPQKVDVPILIPSEALSLDSYLGTGLQDSEEELPTDSSSDSAAAPEVQYDATAMAQLEGMGFPTVRCQKALLATGNADAESAMNWLFQHMEDPDIDDPIPPTTANASSTAAASNEPSADHIAMVSDMGFTPAQARKALRETGGSAEAAIDWLFSHPDDQGDDGITATTPADVPGTTSSAVEKARGSKDLPAQYKLKAFISHKGNSVHSGHYVAHVYKEGIGWVLYNDEKVVKADDGAQSATALMPFAYLYFFQKVQAS